MQERRRLKREQISYYLCILDHKTGQMIGHLVDITPLGLKIDSHLQIPPGEEYQLHLDLTPEIAIKPTLILRARTIWSKPDSLEPNVYNIGFRILNLNPEDAKIIQRITERFGRREAPSVY